MWLEVRARSRAALKASQHGHAVSVGVQVRPQSGSSAHLHTAAAQDEVAAIRAERHVAGAERQVLSWGEAAAALRLGLLADTGPAQRCINNRLLSLQDAGFQDLQLGSAASALPSAACCTPPTGLAGSCLLCEGRTHIVGVHHKMSAWALHASIQPAPIAT